MTDHRPVAMDSFGAKDDHTASTFEADMEEIDRRLKRLYPYVDFETTQVPTHWNKEDKCTFMRVSHLNLRFTYPERPGVTAPDRKNKMEPGAVRANHPCPLFAGVYYFEVHIKESDGGYMGIGLCQKSVKMNRLPGWDSLSYGYHGDDGNFFSSSGQGVPYGPQFGKDDIIGCGLNLVRRSIFFTKNGVNLGPALENIDSVDELYPTVGLQTPNAIVDVNFGQMPFSYDIYKDIQNVRDAVKQQVNEMRMPTAKKKTWLNGYIASWLATEGHAKALKTFCEESNTEYREIDETNVIERKDLSKLVFDRRVGELCEELESKLTNINDVKPLALDLRTQRFAEKVLERITMPPPLAPAKNGLAKEGNGCAAHFQGGESSASSSSISSSTNGSTARHTVAGNGTAAGSSIAPSSSRGPRVSDMLMEQGPSCSTSSSATSLRGGNGMNTMSPSRPHKRRSSGAKVMDGEGRDSSASRPPSSGPPPRRRSARGKEERRKEEDEMEIDNHADLMRRMVSSKGAMDMMSKKNGGPSSSRNIHLTEDELSLLLTTPLRTKTRSSRSKSRSGRKKKGWKGPEIVQEGTSIAPSLKEHEEDIKLRCGYTKAEEEEANRLYEDMLKEGMEISKEAKSLMKKHPSQHKYAMDALYSVMNSREDMENHDIFGDTRARFLVHSLNKGLIKVQFNCAKLCVSKLARLEMSVRTQKVNLMKNGCATAPFIDIEGLMGREQEAYLRTKKGTATFYDPNDMRMLERRRKQAEIDEKIKVERESRKIEQKARRKRNRQLKKKKENEETERMERGEEGDMKEKKKRKRRDGDEKPPVLTEEMPMEIEDGPSSSREGRRHTNSSGHRGHSSRRGRGGRNNALTAERERLLQERAEDGGDGSHPRDAESAGF